jgi:carboxyl-terminal processing protease
MDIIDFLKAVVKLLIMALLTAFVVAGAFSVGYAMQAIETQTAVAAAGPVEPDDTEADASDEFDVFWEAWNFIEDRFYGEIPSEQQRAYGATQGMVMSFGDPNTAFIEPEQAAVFREDVTGSFEGIGAAVQMDELGRLYIVEPYSGKPAAEAGLQEGDIILEVDGVSIQGMNLYEAIALIRGPTDTTVTLTIFREGEGEPFEVPVVRARIEIEIVEAERLKGDIGYVSLAEFNRGASAEIGEAIEQISIEGELSGLIFDLRNNPGGLLDEAILVASQFIEEGTVTIERGNDGFEQIFTARPNGIAVDMPLVVLVNGGSASSSEIVAGAIKENERGVLIGEQTFGKGTVQIPHRLSDGSELRVTIAEWLTPNGNQISGEGIEPDIMVELTQEDYDAGEDPQLDRAVEYLLENK